MNHNSINLIEHSINSSVDELLFVPFLALLYIRTYLGSILDLVSGLSAAVVADDDFSAFVDILTDCYHSTLSLRDMSNSKAFFSVVSIVFFFLCSVSLDCQ